MSIYFDSSALAKLVRSEEETEALRAWITARPGTAWFTNSVGVVELVRFSARISQAARTAAAQLLTRMDQLELTPLALARAANLAPPVVRTLDALHIASATELDDLEAIVTYDHRMIDTCRGYGLAVESPGIA